MGTKLLLIIIIDLFTSYPVSQKLRKTGW